MSRLLNVFCVALIGLNIGLVGLYWDDLVFWSPVSPSMCYQSQFEQYLPMQEPGEVVGKLVLDAPSTCEVGELVRLDTAGSTVVSYRWAIVPLSDDFLVVENGQRAVFSGREPGKYIVVVAAATGDQASLVVHEIEVVAQGGNAEHVVSRWLKKVKYDDLQAKRIKVAELATVFRSLSLDKTEADEMLAKAAAANNEVLGEELELWKEFLMALGHYLDQKAAAGQLETTEDYQAVWREIADALSSATVE